MTHTPQGNESTQGFSDARKARAAFLAVAVVTFFCFVPDLHNDLLIWDDTGYIVENPHIRSLSLETVRWAFFEFYTYYWAPLTWLSLALDYSFWGLNPVGYHLTNTVFHSINAGMFFLLCLELLKRYLAVNASEGKKRYGLTRNSAIYCSLLAALFYALHPLRVESVAWAAERKDVLALFFGIPAVLAYLRHTRAAASKPGFPDPRRSFAVSPFYWLAVVLSCLSLLSKPMLVTLPLVLLVLDWFPLKRFGNTDLKEVLLEKVPLLVCAGFVSMITMIANRPLMVSFERSNMATRALNALKSIMVYLRLTAWPADLSPFYLHPGNITSAGLEYGLPILFFIVVTLCCALLAERRPVFMAVWMIYLITLFPLLGFTQAGPQAMADRYTYLAGLPVSLLAALGITAAFVRWSDSRPARISMVLGTVLLLLIFCSVTVRQISFWKNDVTLWTRVIDLQPHSIGRAYFQRGHAYATRGEFQKALTDMNEAHAIATAKNYREMHTIYVQRARILAQLEDLDGAIADYTSALLSDTSSMRHLYYWERGTVYLKQGRADLANEDFRLAAMAEEGT